MNQTKRHLNVLRPRLSERDFAIIEMVGRFKIVSADQLERVLFTSCAEPTRARSRQFVLKRLCEHKLLRKVGDRAVGGAAGGSSSTLYCLGKKGLEAAALTSSAPRRKYVDYKPHVAHSLAVVETYVRLKRMEQDGRLTLAAFDAEPYCWRTFAAQTLKPDAYVRIKAEKGGQRVSASFFLEVDRNQEWGFRIESKIPAYLAYKASDMGRPFPHVLFLAPTEQRVGYLRRLVTGQAGADARLFQVALVDDFEAMLGL